MRPRAHNKYFVELTEHFQLSWHASGRARVGNWHTHHTHTHTRNKMNRFMLMLPSANITVRIIQCPALAAAIAAHTH